MNDNENAGNAGVGTIPDNGSGSSSAPAAPTVAPAAPKVAVPPITTETVADRLSQHENKEQVAPSASMGTAPVERAPEAVEPPAFDITKLSPEALIALKAALDNAPLRVVKKGNPVVKLRRLNGRIIIDFGNCVNTLYRDDVTNITSDRVLIPVKYLDANGKPEAAFTNVDYKDFMNADQIKCEVIATRREEGGFSEGEVESNERPGIMVELRVKTVKDFFTVKFPEGSGSPVPQAEIEGKIANA